MFQPILHPQAGSSPHHDISSRSSSRDFSSAPLQRKSDIDLFNMLNSCDNLTADCLKTDLQVAVFQLLRFIANSQKELSSTVITNQIEISKLKAKNQQLRSEVKYLTEEVTQLDQYSRKGVMTVTGLSLEEKESQQALETSVVNMLNEIHPPSARTKKAQL